MVALYFGGILMGILMALLLRGTMFKGEAVPFVMELPNYRTLSVLFGSTAELTGAITPVAAASLLVFCLLYTPCVAAIASIKRELGAKWAAYVVLGQCMVAWIAAFIVHLIGTLVM